jgi:membrane-associated phospholipid phosphatase
MSEDFIGKERNSLQGFHQWCVPAVAMGGFTRRKHGRDSLLETSLPSVRNLPAREHSITHAVLLCLAFILVAAVLLMGGRWFSANVSRLAARVSLRARRLAFSSALQHVRERHPGTWEFLARRFEPAEYLGLHLTVGLAISMGALWLFGALTEDVLHHTPLALLDVTILDWFHSHSTGMGVRIFQAVSFLGSPLVLSALGITLAVYFIRRRTWIFFASWIAALIGAGILDRVLKQAIQRPRPSYAAAILHGHSFSFPSGHALASLVAYGMTAYFVVVLWLSDASSRTVTTLAATILILAIGVSRLYLGVHYLTDVLAGYAAGAVWLSACVTGAEIARRQPAVQSSEKAE